MGNVYFGRFGIANSRAISLILISSVWYVGERGGGGVGVTSGKG